MYFLTAKKRRSILLTRFERWDMEDQVQQSSEANPWREISPWIMVHFVIIPLAFFVIWQAQPGSSKNISFLKNSRTRHEKLIQKKMKYGMTRLTAACEQVTGKVFKVFGLTSETYACTNQRNHVCLRLPKRNIFSRIPLSYQRVVHLCGKVHGFSEGERD